MKKNLIALLLAASMILSLAACGGKEPAEETAPEVETEETAPETEPAPETEAPDAEPETEETAPEAEENTPEVKPEEKPEQPAPEAKPEEKPEQPAPETKPEEEAPSAPAVPGLAQKYADAITAHGGEMVQYNPPFTATAEEDGSLFMIQEFLGFDPASMEAFAISVSMMNVKAFGIMAIKPVEGKADTVKAAMETFVANQKQSFENYLADQLEIAQNAKLETLSDGTLLLVMCEGQDQIFESIKAAILA